MADTLQRIAALFVNGATTDVEADEIHADTKLRGVAGVDSLEMAEFFMELEKFDVDLPDYVLAGMETFGELAAEVDRQSPPDE